MADPDTLPSERSISSKWIPSTAGDGMFTSSEDREAPSITKSKLDSGRARAIQRMLIDHYSHELDLQYPWRQMMARDEDIYDHIHWSVEDAAALRERGQVPLVFNVTATAVNWVLGSQRRAPTEYRILARREEGVKHAELKSELLRFISDNNHASMAYQRAFAESVKAGLSWLECGLREDHDGERVFERMESWRNIVFDSRADEFDYSDGRYLFRSKWVDYDRAAAMFPKRKGALMAATRNSDLNSSGSRAWNAYGDEQMDSRELDSLPYVTPTQGTYRPRLRLIEAWFRMPVKTNVMKGGQFSGEIFDPGSLGHWMDQQEGRANVISINRERVYVAIMTESHLVWLSESPYRHNRFPFTPVWGYRRSSDGAPYGMIRGVADIQVDLNKRASKALWHSTAQRAFVQKGAVDDIEEFREEIARPDAVVEYNAGHPEPRIDNDLQHAQAQDAHMSRNIEMIQQISGITDENLGRQTNANSGRAIIARQDQGAQTTNNFYENLRYARKVHGEKLLSLTEQFYPEPMDFRMDDMRGNARFVNINNPDDPATNITATKADFVVSEDALHATQRQANVERLIGLVEAVGAGMPNFAAMVMDLIVEEMDLKKSEEIVKRIRGITGVPDPDADPNDPDPETMAMLQKKQEAEAMQKAAAKLEMAKAEAEVRQKLAVATKAEADAAKVTRSATADSLADLSAAIDAAIATGGNPALSRIADMILIAAQRNAAAAPGVTTQPAKMAVT